MLREINSIGRALIVLGSIIFLVSALACLLGMSQ